MLVQTELMMWVTGRVHGWHVQDQIQFLKEKKTKQEEDKHGPPQCCTARLIFPGT